MQKQSVVQQPKSKTEKHGCDSEYCQKRGPEGEHQEQKVLKSQDTEPMQLQQLTLLDAKACMGVADHGGKGQQAAALRRTCQKGLWSPAFRRPRAFAAGYAPNTYMVTAWSSQGLSGCENRRSSGSTSVQGYFLK